ncbi:MAG: glycosyltransferase family 2 protein [Rubrimonas sp.]
MSATRQPLPEAAAGFDDALDPASDAAFLEAFDLEAPPAVEPGAVTAVVLCHNEALRLPHFLAHHKAAGVTRFLIVDNGSDDGSAGIMDADPAVTRLPSRKSYAVFKSRWRHVLADRYLVGRWVLFPDVDELFVHPGWPEESLPDYCARVEAAGFDCLFTTMVDMYPSGPLSACRYEPGTPFLDAADHFDAGNCRMTATPAKILRRWPTPPVQVFGGARERRFHAGASAGGDLLRRLVAGTLMSMNRGMNPGGLRRRLEKPLHRWLDSGAGCVPTPHMSKVALMRWRRGARFDGGVHRIDAAMALAPDICALLHFKYLDDFRSRSEYLAARGEHASGGAHYKLYASLGARVEEESFRTAISRRFEGVRSLIEAGLMRDRLPR